MRTLLLMVMMTGQYGTNIGIYDDIGATLSPEQIRRYEIGSKCLLAGWTCYVTLIWCLKACMLFFYNRITYALWPFANCNLDELDGLIV